MAPLEHPHRDEGVHAHGVTGHDHDGNAEGGHDHDGNAEGGHDHDGHAEGGHDHDASHRGLLARVRGGHGHGHSHARGLPGSPQALRVLAYSTAVLAAVAAVELGTAVVAGSAAVLADGLHNSGDVLTTVALAAAFILSRRAPTRRFPYGYHRGEDLAGLVVLLLMVASAVASGVTSIEHLVHRTPLTAPAAAFVVALVGFVGNEAVARYKVSAGRRMNSVSLVADGQHSRIDGFASLGAAAGVLGAWLGASVLDPVAGLLVTVVIAAVAWRTANEVTGRLLDEADASLVAVIEEVAAATPGVVEVVSIRTRWTGRRLMAELTLAVPPTDTVSRAHGLGEAVRHALYHRIEALADVIVHLDPAGDDEAHRETTHHRRDTPA